jgi:phosphoglycerol transferase MdoB-like AlkP superfamily enzyme
MPALYRADNPLQENPRKLSAAYFLKQGRQSMQSITQKIKGLPQPILLVACAVFINLLFLTALRIIFWAVFRVPEDPLPMPVLLKSFYLGLKFDMRLALLIHLPVLLLAWIRPIHCVRASSGRRLWSAYLVIINTAVLLFFLFDFGHYEFLQSRMDATVLRFLYNTKESFRMIKETYPVLPGLLLLASYATAYGVAIRWFSIKIVSAKQSSPGRWRRLGAVIAVLLVYLFGIYGKFSWYPLRWSDAFFSTYEFASAVSLNPVLHFFDTLKNKDTGCDLAEVKKYYDTIAAYLDVDTPDKENLNFVRQVTPARKRQPPPNIIMVFLESFTFYKTGISGNPMDPTPHFDEMARNGLLFTRFYTPHGGTARSVFCAVTGIPDIELNKTSSRNPLAVDQHTIINAFRNHEKYYFLGGSASWGEIRGLLAHNIPNLNIYEEGSYSSPRVDVWGISDLHLFEEANRVLRANSDRSFFAIIQTSGNHKPYTIPSDNRGFRVLSVSDEAVSRYGFRSADAYNALRFMDHALGHFIATASREPYFENTIFVFFGDHGLIRNAAHMYKAENQLVLNRYHVPLLIYAPGLIKEGQRFDKVASQVDVLPTLAGLAGIDYVNTTFGRDLLDSRFDSKRYAFTIRHKSGPEIGLIGERFFFTMELDDNEKHLHAVFAENPRQERIDDFPQVFTEMESLCRGFYESARYIRLHNAPGAVVAHSEPHPPKAQTN